MKGNTLLARLRNTRGRRLLIALVAVPAILVGLLAMHVLTNTGMDDSAAMSRHHAESAISSPAENMATQPSGLTQADDCSGFCGPSDDMLGIMCVLALLATIVLLAVRLALVHWAELRRLIAALIAKANALAPPQPPSLHVLSISRT